MRIAIDESDCVDCLCRVCARNRYIDAYNKTVEQDNDWCEGCNLCNEEVIENIEDCPREAFLPDESI